MNAQQYSTNIHCETMRLRLLLTNYCQMNCKHCLNEYMPKGGEKQNLSLAKVKLITSAYVKRMKEVNPDVPTKVYLSGGEPTLNPEFNDIVDWLYPICDELTLCSNGHNYKSLIRDGVYDKITNLHFSFGALQYFDFLNQWENICTWLESFGWNRSKNQLVLSIVTTMDPDLERLISDLLLYESKHNFKLKLWGDLRYPAEHEINVRYLQLLAKFPQLLHRGPVKHPVNRKSGCEGCTNTCPTLKALWVRPNGTASFCPQANDSHWSTIVPDNCGKLIDETWIKLFQ